MSDSKIVIGKSSTTFVGRDATQLVRAAALEACLRLYAKTGIIPTRGLTISKMLVAAAQYTGKKYRRGSANVAAADLKVWVETMKSALPVERVDE
jgi:hypothetical protein